LKILFSLQIEHLIVGADRFMQYDVLYHEFCCHCSGAPDIAFDSSGLPLGRDPV
jgi:hypothetical protein